LSDPSSPAAQIPKALRVADAIRDADPNSPLETADFRRNTDAQEQFVLLNNT
jgi:hypothetical protein